MCSLSILKLQALITNFLRSLVEDQGVLQLSIPMYDNLENVDVIDEYDAENSGEVVRTKKIESIDSAKGYAQIFAVASVVFSLLSGFNTSCVVFLSHAVICRGKDSISTRCVLLHQKSFQVPARMQQLHS